MSDEHTVPPEKLFFAVKYLIGPSILLACLQASRCPFWARLFFFGWYTYHLLQAMSIRTGNIWHDYSNGATLGGEIFQAMFLSLFVEPVRDWRHLRSDGEKNISSRPWWQRVYWCLCAKYTARGVGWNHQVAGVPAPSRLDRARFLCRAFLRIIFSYLLLDIAQCLIQTTPFFDNPQPNVSMRLHPYHHQIYYMILCFSVPYGALNFNYNIAAFLAIISGYSSPVDWPDLFGRWSDAYSVRNVWGKIWHQIYRRHYLAIGKVTARFLGAPPSRDSLLSLMIQIHIVFLVTGISHSFGDYTVGFHHFQPSKFGLGMSLPFYLMQPFGIFSEELVRFGYTEYFSNSNSKSKLNAMPCWINCHRYIGYAWTLAWFTYSASWYIDSAAQAGFGKTDIVSFSVIRFVGFHLNGGSLNSFWYP